MVYNERHNVRSNVTYSDCTILHAFNNHYTYLRRLRTDIFPISTHDLGTPENLGYLRELTVAQATMPCKPPCLTNGHLSPLMKHTRLKMFDDQRMQYICGTHH